MNLEVSPLALTDLREIARYASETWGQEQAQTYLDQIYSAFEEIASDPERFRRRPDLFDSCQIMPVGKHIVFFEFIDDRVAIVRVSSRTDEFSRSFLIARIMETEIRSKVGALKLTPPFFVTTVTTWWHR